MSIKLELFTMTAMVAALGAIFAFISASGLDAAGQPRCAPENQAAQETIQETVQELVQEAAKGTITAKSTHRTLASPMAIGGFRVVSVKYDLDGNLTRTDWVSVCN